MKKIFFLLSLVLLLPMALVNYSYSTESQSIRLHPTDDVHLTTNFVDNALSNVNEGDLSFIVVFYSWNYNVHSDQLVSLGLLKFDLEDIDKQKIAKAELNMKKKSTNVNPDSSITIFPVDFNDWSESDVTYSTRPPISQTPIATSTISANQDWETWDITSHVKNSSTIEYSIAMVFANIADNNEEIVRFFSTEAENPDDYPYLEITYFDTVTIAPTDDTFMAANLHNPTDPTGIQDVNNGATDFIRIGYALNVEGEENHMIALSSLKFDLSNFKSEDIVSAQLHLKTIGIQLIQDALPISLISIDDDWNESDITYNNRPELSNVVNSVSSITSADTWYSWDVTNLVQENAGSNVSFGLLPSENIQNSVELAEFFSKESNDSTTHPYLEITMTEPSQESQPSDDNEGGCLIATATFGSEMAPQVQLLREIRDDTVLNTQSGMAFMTSFNQFYYSFSPYVADYERANPLFKEAVKLGLTPMISTLSILSVVDMDSEAEVLGYGIGVILLNIGMYFVAPAMLIVGIRKLRSKI